MAGKRKAPAKEKAEKAASIPSTSGAEGHAEHEMDQARRGRPTGLAYREGR